jgi:hypothetical protein
MFRGDEMPYNTKQRDKRNKEKYVQYIFRVNKETDGDLIEMIEEFMSKKNTSLNYLIVKLLREWLSTLY